MHVLYFSLYCWLNCYRCKLFGTACTVVYAAVGLPTLFLCCALPVQGHGMLQMLDKMVGMGYTIPSNVPVSGEFGFSLVLGQGGKSPTGRAPVPARWA